MSYFVLGVGGTGAKLMQTLVHLSAAGLLPDPRRGLDGLLIDPDDANGNVDECSQLVKAYRRCAALGTGTTDLFSRSVEVRGPWTPIRRQSLDTLNEIFHFTQRQESIPVESELMELLFSDEERDMKIHQGFRGRPAIGATVLSNAVDFSDEKDVWKGLLEKVKSSGSFDGGVPVLLAGSVFGGSGAAGVPTILQLLRKPLNESVHNVRLGLILFLPYFIFDPVPGEAIQADPFAFPLATSEALKYYAERGFLDKCHSVYAVGEQNPARMAVSAVGSADQRNEPHFVELIAGLGALRFFDDGAKNEEEHTLLLAGRRDESTLTWEDLPTAKHLHEGQVHKLQRMIQFAVAFHLSFYPKLSRELSARDTRIPLLRHNVLDERLPKEDAQRDLAYVEDYVVRFLKWLLGVSAPRREGFTPGLVDVNVFAQKSGSGEWSLRTEFRKEKDFRNLFLNAPGRRQPDLDTMWRRANENPVTDANAKRTGRLVRAIYDSCEV